MGEPDDIPSGFFLRFFQLLDGITNSPPVFIPAAHPHSSAFPFSSCSYKSRIAKIWLKYEQSKTGVRSGYLGVLVKLGGLLESLYTTAGRSTYANLTGMAVHTILYK